jgi:hypothetical protein
VLRFDYWRQLKKRNFTYDNGSCMQDLKDFTIPCIAERRLCIENEGFQDRRKGAFQMPLIEAKIVPKPIPESMSG